MAMPVMPANFARPVCSGKVYKCQGLQILFSPTSVNQVLNVLNSQFTCFYNGREPHVENHLSPLNMTLGQLIFQLHKEVPLMLLKLTVILTWELSASAICAGVRLVAQFGGSLALPH